MSLNQVYPGWHDRGRSNPATACSFARTCRRHHFHRMLPGLKCAAILCWILCSMSSCGDDGGPSGPIPAAWQLTGRWYAIAHRFSPLTPDGHLAMRLQITQWPDTVEIAFIDGRGTSHSCERTSYEGTLLRFDMSGASFQAEANENSMKGTWIRPEGAGEPGADRWLAARNPAAGGYSGRWQGVVRGLDPGDGQPDEVRPIQLTTVVAGDSLFTLMSVYLRDTRLGGGLVLGDSLYFVAGDEEFRGEVSGDSISGSWVRRGGGGDAITDSGTWSAGLLD